MDTVVSTIGQSENCTDVGVHTGDTPTEGRLEVIDASVKRNWIVPASTFSAIVLWRMLEHQRANFARLVFDRNHIVVVLKLGRSHKDVALDQFEYALGRPLGAELAS